MLMTMLDEIYEIPEKAELIFKGTGSNIDLPLNVPYLGMGSSYYAAMALKYVGVNILVDVASDFYFYTGKSSYPLGVLISQSGYSSEVIWCAEKFDRIISISNNSGSTLATNEKVVGAIDICAGEERFSSSKTYINTLIALYKGHGIDVKEAIKFITNHFTNFEKWGKVTAEKVFYSFDKKELSSLLFLGFGANTATACQSALITTESSRIFCSGMSVSQFDHGPKEACKNMQVIVFMSNGPEKDRCLKLIKLLEGNGAFVYIIDHTELPEMIMPITSIVPVNFFVYYLSQFLGINDTFAIGNKITRV